MKSERQNAVEQSIRAAFEDCNGRDDAVATADDLVGMVMEDLGMNESQAEEFVWSFYA